VTSVTDFSPLAPLPPPVPAPMISAPTKDARPTGAWVLIASGAALVVGAFLPWLEATTIFGTITRTGVSYGSDALATAGLGVALGVFGILLATGKSTPGWAWILSIVGAAVALAILVYDYGQLKDRADSVSSDVAQASVG
jgi:hypothetical protein